MKVNRKREQQTYGKMFFNKKAGDPKQQQSSNQASAAPSADKKEPISVSEYLERKFPAKGPTKFKTVEDKELDEEMSKIDREVEQMIQKKVREFSFEIKPDLAHFEEID